MKSLTRFLMLALCVTSPMAHAAVPSTAGSNLTAYNPTNMGSVNNNNWNNAMIGRTSGTGAEANFGNCNSLILRCAQPKCATGGCTSMDVAVPIVSGCVKSNETCKKYGDDLIQSIAAQLVANSTAKVNAATINAQAAAATAAAEQSQQQLQAMQSQMQQMQSQMAQQNAAAQQQLQAALAEQKELAAQAAAAAAAAATSATSPAPESNLNQAQVDAASNGVSADVLVRQQVSGQIMESVEAAMVAMKSLKATMEDVFAYAGCDRSGNNCTGPKRVKVFKEKAANFFDPYENVLDQILDALEMAQSVGVDITDILLMLNGTCSSWAKYMCTKDQEMHYGTKTCDANGKSIAYGSVRAGQPCTMGGVIPQSNGGCQMITMLTNDEEVQQNWLYPDTGDENSQIRVGCASDVLNNSVLFRGRRKQANIDIDILRRMIEQDAPNVGGSVLFGGSKKSVIPDAVKYCAVNDESYAKLQQAALMKKLPDKVCVTQREMDSAFSGYVPSAAATTYKEWGGADFVTSRDCKQALGEIQGDNCVCPANGQKIDPNIQSCIGATGGRSAGLQDQKELKVELPNNSSSSKSIFENNTNNMYNRI